MTPGYQFRLEGELYAIDLIGPVTTLLLRADGVYVHAKTWQLRAYLENNK